MNCQNIDSQEFLDKITEEAELRGDVEKLKRSFSSPEETITTFMSNKAVKEELALFVKKFYTNGRYSKSKEMSEKFRNEGNDLFSSPYPKLSLKYFTLALKFAPKGTNEARLAFGNRSAVLFLMEEYEKSLQDIEYALIDEDNFERQVKLLVRKAKCYTHLRQFKDSADVFHVVINMLHLLKTNEFTPRLQKLKREAENGLQKILEFSHTNLPAESKNGSDTSGPGKLPQLAYGKNPNFPCASDGITLRENPLKGRYVVANRDIAMGDILFVEKPFAFVVLPLCSTTHCHNCCISVLNPLPCERCAEASYCSENCRSAAWEVFHRWECGPGMELCYSLGIAHLGLRLTLVGSTTDDPNYYLVDSLVSHLDDLKANDLFQFAATGALMGTYLQNCTNFFHVHKDLKFSHFCGTVLKHIAQLICNGHAITGLFEGVDEGKEVYSEEQIRIATAIFPSASMMNHSCDSNIMNSFSGQYLIVKASKTISGGEEVFNCYGPHYRRMGWSERQKCLMEQYQFQCECPPCRNPSQKEFLQRFCGYLCSECSGPVLELEKEEGKYTCADCSRLQPIAHTKRILDKADGLCAIGEQALEAQNIQKALSKFKRALNLKEAVLYKHHTGIRDCKNKIAKCYAILGQYDESFNYAEDALFGDEEQFGECSPEFVHEVLKLSDICYKISENVPLSCNRRMVVKKTISFMERAKIAMSILFGKWHHNYKELAEREVHFRNLLCHN